MPDYADLELSLSLRDADTYTLEFRLSLPDSDTDERERAPVRFDPAELEKLEYDPKAYGKKLTSQLLGDPAALAAYTASQASAQDRLLRLRLSIQPNARELHDLHWEALRDPKSGELLFANENPLFSRYLSSRDWRAIRPRPKGDWKALVVVANPANLSAYQLGAVDVAREAESIQGALKGIPIDLLPNEGSRASLPALESALRDGGYDIVYLVAHGVFSRKESWLYLEDEQGLVKRVPGAELAARLSGLSRRPRLFVLASCQSASQEGAGAMAGIGPLLAEAGIPAVLAMAGKVSVKTISEFMPVFFSELDKNGQVDRAAALARGAVRDNSDFWMPVLFSRLRSGCLWHVPSFFNAGSGQEQSEFDQWKSITDRIDLGQCTPILGPGTLEPIFGSRREIARAWADEHGYPLSPDDQDDLPHVAQYLSTRYDPDYLLLQYNQALRHRFLKNFTPVLTEDWLELKSWSPEILLQATSRAAEHLGEDGPLPLYKHLAELPLPVYVTTNPADMLEEALRQAGKEPQVLLCPWNSDIESMDRELWSTEALPTPRKPLIYHLFGRYQVPESLVLTEDHYLDFLIGLTENKDIIPPVVSGALTGNVLLFLGFQVEDWNFRVFFRSLMTKQGSKKSIYKNHLAAQIEPDEDRIQNPQRARRFLERYFKPGNVSIYWGSAAEFLAELARRL